MTLDPAHQSGPHANQVVFDLLCHVCKYNLKTIHRDGYCPECGEPVVGSIKANMDQAKWRFELVNDPGKYFRSFAELTGMPFNRIAFICLAICYVHEIGEDRHNLKIQPKRMTAADLCHAIREIALSSFGADAKEELMSLQLATSQRVHAAVLALDRLGVLPVTEDASWGGFGSEDCPDPVDF